MIAVPSPIKSALVCAHVRHASCLAPRHHPLSFYTNIILNSLRIIVKQDFFLLFTRPITFITHIFIRKTPFAMFCLPLQQSISGAWCAVWAPIEECLWSQDSRQSEDESEQAPLLSEASNVSPQVPSPLKLVTSANNDDVVQGHKDADESEHAPLLSGASIVNPQLPSLKLITVANDDDIVQGHEDADKSEHAPLLSEASNVNPQVPSSLKPITLANDNGIAQGHEDADQSVPALPEPLFKDELKRQRAREKKKRNQNNKKKRAAEQVSQRPLSSDGMATQPEISDNVYVSVAPGPHKLEQPIPDMSPKQMVYRITAEAKLSATLSVRAQQRLSAAGKEAQLAQLDIVSSKSLFQLADHCKRQKTEPQATKKPARLPATVQPADPLTDSQIPQIPHVREETTQTAIKNCKKPQKTPLGASDFKEQNKVKTRRQASTPASASDASPDDEIVQTRKVMTERWKKNKELQKTDPAEAEIEKEVLISFENSVAEHFAARGLRYYQS